MTCSEKIDLLSAALVKAQAVTSAPKRTHEVKAKTFSYTYSPLDEVVAVLRKPLADNGLAFVQSVETHEGQRGVMVGVETLILHESGQWLSCGSVRIPAGLSAQDYGSALSYTRRYSLQAAFGLATEDTDAQGATEPPTTPDARPPVSAPKPAQEPPDFGPDDDLIGPNTPASFPGASVKVTGIKWAKSKPDAAKPWSVAFLTFSDSREAATFDTDVQATLQKAHKEDLWVFISTEPSKKDPAKRTIIGAQLARDLAG